MSLLKRPPGDDFTFRLFFQLINRINHPKDSIYIWSAVIDPTYEYGHWPEKNKWVVETELDYRTRLTETINQDLIVMGVKDHLTSLNFNPLTQAKPAMVEYLENLFNYYSNKKFILFTSVENLSSYIQNKNVSIIPWGGDITNHKKEYEQLQPLAEKNFDSLTTFLSLNRNQRTHRAMLVSLLYKLNLQDHGIISCMFKDKITSLMEYTNWTTDKTELFEEGFKQFKQQELRINDNYDIYTTGPNDNVNNFKNKLADYYQNSFVEIITETSYTESCYNLTEKTLNSIYGCCFPIILCSKGTVEFLRSMGMDVFDDVIDHSYDQIEDPTDRLYHAVVDNIELLKNTARTKELWKLHQYRFIKNIDFAKTTLYNFYSSRAEQLLLKAIDDYQL